MHNSFEGDHASVHKAFFSFFSAVRFARDPPALSCPVLPCPNCSLPSSVQCRRQSADGRPDSNHQQTANDNESEDCGGTCQVETRSGRKGKQSPPGYFVADLLVNGPQREPVGAS